MLSNSNRNTLANRVLRQANDLPLLGSGGSGEVYRVDDMVVKKMDVSTDELADFKKEVAAWAEFSSNPHIAPYIPRYLGHVIKKTDRPPMPSYNSYAADPEKFRRNERAWFNSEEPDYYCFIIQAFEPVVDLAEYLETNPRITYDFGYPLFNNLIAGFQHIHEAGYIHRDIKTKNILIRTTGAHTTMPIIIDFGLACKIPCAQDALCRSNNMGPMGSNFYIAQNMLPLADRSEFHERAFPVARRPNSMLQKVKMTLGCARRRPNKTVKVRTSTNKLPGVYTIATDNYALALVLADVYDSIDWSAHKPEKMEAKAQIDRLRSQIIPYLAATKAARR
jgi:serine/threonine protein kinase